MSNKHKEPKGKKKAPKEQKTRILVFLATWAREMFSYDDDFFYRQELLTTLKKVYLISDWANDQKERTDVLMLFEQLEDLMESLAGFQYSDFEVLDEFILKQSA